MDTPTLIGTGFFILAVVVWIVCVVMARQAAPTFGRSATSWTVLTIFFGPIALMILYVLPKKQPLPGHGTHKEDPRAALYEKPKHH
jgi:hypothetical protein